MLSVLMMSCKKGKAEFHLSGKVEDSSFKSSLSGAVVKLYELEVGTKNENLIGSVISSSEGTYSFSFERNKVESQPWLG